MEPFLKKYFPAVLTNLALVIFGLLLAAAFLEASLRLLGWAHACRQEHRNKLFLGGNKTRIVLCVGESTTASQYPALLERILNSSFSGIRFRVVDKGMVGVNTDIILYHLPKWLDEYKPDIVVSMMGINDHASHLPQYERPESAIQRFAYSLRIYKLYRLLLLHISSRPARQASVLSSFCRPAIAYAAVRPEIARLDVSISSMAVPGELDALRVLLSDGEFYQAETRLAAILSGNPKNITALHLLAQAHAGQGRYRKAEKDLLKAVAADSTNPWTYLHLGRIYTKRGDKACAVSCYVKLLELDWNQPIACAELMILMRGLQMQKAEEILKHSVALIPDNPNLRALLGLHYLSGNDSKLYGQILNADSKMSAAAVLALAGTEQRHKAIVELASAAELWQTRAGITRQDRLPDIVYNLLEEHYILIGDRESARRYSSRATAYRPLPDGTRRNYIRLRDILRARNIKYVCAQYPLRPVWQLREIFGAAADITFIDNEKTFKDAVSASGYDEYFSDIFAGDFGHCTARGNVLLAQNIARAILDGF